jgi:hypothetical protein
MIRAIAMEQVCIYALTDPGPFHIFRNVQGITCEPSFGVAPSTLTFRSQSLVGSDAHKSKI